MYRRLILCGMLLCAAPGAHGTPPPPCGEIRLAYYELGSLYYRDGDGAWTGIDKDVIDELARRTGCKFQTFLDSRVRIWTTLANGTLAMSVSGIANPERERFARFVPYFTTHNYILLRKEVASEVRGLDDFVARTDYKVAVVKSFHHGPTLDLWLERLRVQGRVFEAGDFNTVQRLFQVGRVQAIIALGTSWAAIARRADMRELFTVRDWAPDDAIVHNLILSRKLVPEATVGRFSLAIRAMREDGTLKKIYQRHVGPELAAALLGH